MNKRTARRLAAATALVAPSAVGIHVTAHAAPTILTPSPNSTVGGRSVTIFARYHAPRPVVSAKVFVDNLPIATRNFQPAGLSGVVNVTWDSTAVIPGAHRITIKMYDRAGNVVAQDTVPVSILNDANAPDTIPPQVAILSPDSKKPVQGSFDIRVLATDNSGKDPYVSVFVDQQLRGVSNRQPYTFSINSAEYENGVHMVEAWAYDAAANKATANAVSLHINNVGGATRLNEDVNRLGAAPAENGVEPAATEPTLPAVETSKPAPITQPVAAPKLVAQAPPAAPPPAIQPAEALVPEIAAPAPKAAEAAPVAPIEVEQAPPVRVPSPRMAALPPGETRRVEAHKPSPGPSNPVPLVHIPPVREVKVTPRVTPEPAIAATEEPSAPRAIEELPVEATPLEPLPASGILEIPAEPIEATESPAPVSERVSAPVEAAPAPPPPVSVKKPETSARTMMAALPAPAKAAPKTAPKVAAPKPAAKADAPKPAAKADAPKPAAKADAPKPAAKVAAPKPAAKADAPKPAPKPAAPVVLPPAPVEPPVKIVAEERVEAAPPAPIVLQMRGDRVIEPAPAPKPVLVARADVPTAPPSVRPTAGNPAPSPARLTPLPPPTAPAVRANRTPSSPRVAAAPKPSARPVDLRPAIIPELPADRVQDGRILHAARPGETVQHLARHYGVPVKRLLAENSLGGRQNLRIGRDVRIPAPFRVAFNNETVQFDVAPRIQNGVTLAALRQIYERAGGHLTWDPALREVRASGAGADIIVRIGSNEAFVNGRRVSLSAPSFIEDGRTFLPVAFISQTLGLRAEYDLRSGAVHLHSAQADADYRRPA